MFCEIHQIQDNNLTLQNNFRKVHICQKADVYYPNTGDSMMQTYEPLCGGYTALTDAQGYGSSWPKDNDGHSMCKRCVKAHTEPAQIKSGRRPLKTPATATPT